MKIKILYNALLAVVLTLCVTSSVLAQESNTLRIVTGSISETLEISGNAIVGTPFSINGTTGGSTTTPEANAFCSEYAIMWMDNCYIDDTGKVCDDYGCFDEEPYCDESGCYYCDVEGCYHFGGNGGEEVPPPEGGDETECGPWLEGSICSPGWGDMPNYYEAYWFSANVHSWVNGELGVNLANSSTGSCTISQSVENQEQGEVYMLIANDNVSSPCRHTVSIDESMPILNGDDYFVFNFFLDMSVGPLIDASSQLDFYGIFRMNLTNQGLYITAYGNSFVLPSENKIYAVQVIKDNNSVTVTINNQVVGTGSAGGLDGFLIEGMEFTAKGGSFKISQLTLDIRSPE